MVAIKESRMKDISVVTNYLSLQTIVPNRWQGEYDCLVGPFSSRNVAEYFVSAVVDFGAYESFNRRVFAKGDSWYVEVQANEVPKQVAIQS
jgi:hypothetical protein